MRKILFLLIVVLMVVSPVMAQRPHPVPLSKLVVRHAGDMIRSGGIVYYDCSEGILMRVRSTTSTSVWVQVEDWHTIQTHGVWDKDDTVSKSAVCFQINDGEIHETFLDDQWNVSHPRCITLRYDAPQRAVIVEKNIHACRVSLFGPPRGALRLFLYVYNVHIFVVIKTHDGLTFLAQNSIIGGDAYIT